MTHDQLCDRALRWLRGTLRCNPVFSRNASCSEIPDAIGWTSYYNYRGSIVVECKTSVSDFHADKKKKAGFKNPSYGDDYIFRASHYRNVPEGCERIVLPRMGDFRYFMCQPGVITPEMIEKHAPDHGLLHAFGRRINVVVMAKRRTEVDRVSEIRYLRFAIINSKKPFEPEIVQQVLAL